MKKLPYSEGSVFLVPLRNGGYARGVVARSGRKGKVLLGYFFGPRLELAETSVSGNLEPCKAVMCLRFGDLGLINGEWPIVGKVPLWNRASWPMPDFVRIDPISKNGAVIVRYSDVDPNEIVYEGATTDDCGLGTDSMFGYGAVEIKLTKILG